MFNGSWSTGVVTGGSASGGGGGTWSIGPMLAPAATQQNFVSAPASYSYSAPSGSNIGPAAQQTAGPYGEGGPYTPLDYPAEMKLLGDFAPQQVSSFKSQVSSPLCWLALALGLLALLKN